jgi:hypothetical protein
VQILSFLFFIIIFGVFANYYYYYYYYYYDDDDDDDGKTKNAYRIWVGGLSETFQFKNLGGGWILIDNRIYGTLMILTTNDYNILTNLNILQVITTSATHMSSVCYSVITSHC